MNRLDYYLFREKIIKHIRIFFEKRKFHEVITPVFNEYIPLEPNIHPFKINHYVLSISPEKNLKKMLALGMKNCFSIGHSFRNLEAIGPLHTPEFLMLEWYRRNTEYTLIMKDVKELICFLDKKSTKGWKIFSLPELFKTYTKLDLIEFVSHKKNRADYDKLFVNEIESRLPETPCFIIDYPSIISPLCKPKKNNPLLAERFEFYWKGVELANGNTENTDIESVKKGLRKPLDREFLNSLKKMQNASYAGVGLGLDRLLMILSNSNVIYQ